VLRVAVMKFGADNWFLETMLDKGFDVSNGFKMEIVPMAFKMQTLMPVQDDEDNGEERARRLLRDVELDTLAESFPGQLSPGMQKRVALARAFALSPTLLLMDEPFSSLDPEIASRLVCRLCDC